MRINHNIASLNALNYMSINEGKANSSLQKLSSGLRINKAGDDAAGLAISEKMRAQINGLDQASSNAQDGISLIQTAEGGLNEVHSILQRMRELADQSANGTNTADDRKAIQDEVGQLKQEIDRIGNTTEFNTQKLLNGDLKNAGGVSVGTNTTMGAVVGKLTAGNVTASGSMHAASASLTASDFVAEKMNIDGTDITVHWENLTTDERAVLQNVGSTDAASENTAMNLIVSKINEAIDASGTNIAHVTGYVAGDKLTIQSGSTGINSGVTPFTNTAGAGVLDTFMNYGSAGSVTAGKDVYNGATITGGATGDMYVNGVLMQVTFTSYTGAGALAMTTAAVKLQSDINLAISNYNNTTGKVSGQDGFVEDVTVQATADGRFQINSQSGPVSFAERAGQTVVSDLGLTQAQTDSAGGGGMTFQIGANHGQTISFGINDMRTASLGIAGVDVSTATGASNALTSLDSAIESVSLERSKLGAVQNRLEHTINNLNTSSENLTAAESRIRDVDMAKEMTEFTKDNILSQAAQAMLAQANQQPQGVLQLLR